MHTQFPKTLAAAVVALVATIVAAAPAMAEIHLVREGESIQAAIDIAAFGDVIFVMPGEYSEHLEIVDKSLSVLSVLGTTATTLRLEPGESGATGIVVAGDSDGTRLEGFTLLSPDTGVPWPQTGLLAGADLTVSNCVFDRCAMSAIHAAPGISPLVVAVEGTSFVHCTCAILEDLRLDGCCDSRLLMVAHCTFDSCTRAVDSEIADVTVEDCTFSANSFPVTARGALAIRRSTIVDSSREAIVSFGDTLLEDVALLGMSGARNVVDINSPSNVTIRSCYFGGIRGFPSAVTIDCSGAIDVSGSTFANSSGTGSVLSLYTSQLGEPIRIQGCTFVDNIADDILTLRGAAPAVVSDCRFVRNEGAAIATIGLGSPSSIDRCTFVANTSTRRDWLRVPGVPITSCTLLGNNGDAILLSCASMTNCLLVGNRGGVQIMTNDYLAPLLGSTFVANVDFSIYSPIIVGCIVQFNSPRSGQLITYSPAAYSNIPGRPDNIDADPLFIRNPSPGLDNQWGTPDDFYGDLRLRPGSPCIDAGTSYRFPDDVLLDLAGNPRFIDDPATMDTGVADHRRSRPVADIGAHEFQPDAPPPCPCDFDGNGRIETADLLIYVNLWFEQAPAANLDTDAAIDVRDLLAFLDCFLTPRADPTAC